MTKELLDLAREDTNLKKVSSNEYAGPCPACGGRDRFHVHLAKRDGRGGWMCRVCHPAETMGWGDTIEYLRVFKQMSFREAKDYLQDGIAALIKQVDEGKREVAPDENKPPKEQWQVKASAYVQIAARRLWSPDGAACLDYLHARGLQDATIKAAQLGYVEDEEEGERIPRLVIPWHGEHGQYWAVNRRDLRNPLPKGAARYKMLAWSNKKAMYGCDLLTNARRHPTFVVEGELDALTLAQEAKGLPINVVATGGAGMPAMKWIARLSRMPLLLIANDREERGDKMAQAWLEVFKQDALRYRPLAKDVNEMLTTGWSVRTWVEGALDLLPVNPANVNRVLREDTPATAPVEQEQASASEPGDQAQDSPLDTATVGLLWALEGAPYEVIEDVSNLLAVTLEDQDQLEAATWLAQLHAAWLARDCAALFDLVEQIEYPGALFLERAGLQLEQPATGDLVEPTAQTEQDAGAAFLDQVRNLVDGAGAWPGGYTLRLVDDAFAARIHALPDQVKPVAGYKSRLEPLPRKRCPGLVLSTTDIPGETKKNRSQVARPCPGKPLANGWCQDHQRGQLLLDMGAALDYPRIELGATAIGAGLAHWESFACYANTAIKAALPRVKRLFDQAQRDQDQAAS